MSPYRTCALIVVAFRLRTTFGGRPQGTATATTGRRSSAIGGARRVAAKCDWRAPSRVVVLQDSVDPRQTQVFRAHAAPQGMCDNLINSLKHLTNQQKDGDTLVETVVTSLLEKSCKGIMDGLRKLIAVDNHDAVKVGGLRQGIQVVKPQFSAVFPEAIIRE